MTSKLTRLKMAVAYEKALADLQARSVENEPPLDYCVFKLTHCRSRLALC